MLDGVSAIVPFFNEIDKADNILKNSYIRYYFNLLCVLLCVGIAISGIIYSITNLESTYEILTLNAYEDNPHTLEPITIWDFLLSDNYKYVATYVLYEFTLTALRIFSDLSGGIDIPKKP